ncbi:hypothetical protein FACS1894211_13800 [Clostridia bacterium]|nr:hypothetical protein FACS1894211_13800 [Clostridia bacterium]
MYINMKKIKKIKRLMAAILSCMLLFAGVGCRPNDPPELPDNSWEEEYAYFKPLNMNAGKKLKVFGFSGVQDLTADQLLIATAIQGIFAKDEVTYYNGGPPVPYTSVWLNNLIENYNVTVEYVTLDEMMTAYVNQFGTAAGYSLCSLGNDSVNAATNAAAAENVLPATAATSAYLGGYGLNKTYDFTDVPAAYFSAEHYSFTLFKSKLNDKGLFSLTPERLAARDYAVACGYYTYYMTDAFSPESLDYVGEIYDWVERDSPVFGWGGIDEATDVNRHSQYGLFTIACDWGYNWSVHACPAFYGNGGIKQKTVEADTADEENVHYVSIVMSDGDNIQAVTNTLARLPEYFNHNGGDFPMGYNIAPSLVELGAGVLKYCYNLTGTSDYFVGAVSGQGYINPGSYSELDKFCSRMSWYLKRADLNVVQVLDNSIGSDVRKTYAKIGGLKGVQVMLGDYYEQGFGSVYWENDIPFVTCRVSLWQGSSTGGSAQAAAARINGFSTDVHSAAAYTMVNVHPWSMSYEDVCQMVSLLNGNVRVVTANRFFDLLARNVPHENVTLGF